jgi:erythromycin esterase-like protein
MTDVDAPSVPPEEQARAIAEWIRATKQGKQGHKTARFPGLSWLRQPDNYSDREWILAIAEHYRKFDREHAMRSSPPL